jgi:hypothetical protein
LLKFINQFVKIHSNFTTQNFVEAQVTTTERTDNEIPEIRVEEGKNDNETTRSTTKNDVDDTRVKKTGFNITGRHKSCNKI